VASCAEGPTLPPDDAAVAPLLKKGGGGGGGPPQLRDVDVEIPTGNALIDDGLGPYRGENCAVVAKAGSSFSFFPFYGAMNRKERKDYENDPNCRDINGTLIQRSIRVDLANAMVHDPASHPNEDVTLAQLIIDQGLDPIGSDDVMNHAKVSVFDGSGVYQSRVSFGVPYCNYLMFDDEVGSNDLTVAQTEGNVRVETQAWPDNVGLCAHDTGGDEPLVILLHLDIAYDAKDKP
jgi:hypothetical protein